MPGNQKTPKKLISGNVAAKYNCLPGTGTPLKKHKFFKALNLVEEYENSKIGSPDIVKKINEDANIEEMENYKRGVLGKYS